MGLTCKCCSKIKQQDCFRLYGQIWHTTMQADVLCILAAAVVSRQAGKHTKCFRDMTVCDLTDIIHAAYAQCMSHVKDTL